MKAYNRKMCPEMMHRESSEVQIKTHQGPANSRFKILSADFGEEAWAKGEPKQEIWFCKVLVKN